MAPVRRDAQIVARFELNDRARVFKAQARVSAQHDHPLIQVLIQPLAVGCALTRGNNPFDSKVILRYERLQEFFFPGMSDLLEYITECIRHVWISRLVSGDR